MTTIEANMAALRSRYPKLAELLDGYPDKDAVCLLKAKDGGTCYGLKKNGTVVPLTDCNRPLTKIQNELMRNSAALNDFTKQVLIVGLYPGDELLYIFDRYERAPEPKAKQRIILCIDSMACLQGFLTSYDARAIIESDRVHVFQGEDAQIEVQKMREQPDSSYSFTLISGAPGAVLDGILPHFARFNEERRKEALRLQAENNAYYNNISDAQLADAIAGRAGRSPRFMTTTSAWSTVVQHSARDTCASFRAAGWETEQINVKSMLTPYFLAKRINEFKPDIFLFINHLRTEAKEAYPDNMLFLTWIQDFCPLINQTDAAAKWKDAAEAVDPATGRARRRDFIIGYAQQLKKYGYPHDRLFDLNMIVNPEIFKPREISNSLREKYRCDVCFASNWVRSAEQAINEEIAPALSAFHIGEPLLLDILDHLRNRYREGESFTTYSELETELVKIKDFNLVFSALSNEDRDRAILLIFWRINDPIYRQTVLEWCDELGVDLKLYGLGWDKHPGLARHAAGPIEHGEELSAAYQVAKYSLHLNSMEGMHQRLLEITASGGRPITRLRNKSGIISKELAGAYRNKADGKPLSKHEQMAWNDWAFGIVSGILRQNPAMESADLQNMLEQTFTRRLNSKFDWAMPDWGKFSFNSKNELAAILLDQP
jgi:hypothetical protein